MDRHSLLVPGGIGREDGGLRSGLEDFNIGKELAECIGKCTAVNIIPVLTMGNKK
ncbi:hypothetical protein [Christiangramia sediminis]|uniref:Uncharacterized protein n=1 Tax=Christiangramia sediminis TaxID=2881336 RepID=A0A9X1LLA2_9FLAO|nr:hypothetical protein [Christiangramia sediminis]MCB7482470.1 hypothetical protein [Christiangramia sediminis]